MNEYTALVNCFARCPETVRTMRILLATVLSIALALAWTACDDDETGNPLDVESADLAPGEAVWVVGSDDRYEGRVSFEHHPATEHWGPRTSFVLRTEPTGGGEPVEVWINLPEVTDPVTHTEAGCEAFVNLTGYWTPIDDPGVGWRSCCGIPGQPCTPSDIRCGIDEVGETGIRGNFRSQLFYKSGFVMFDSTRVRGVFFAVPEE